MSIFRTSAARSQLLAALTHYELVVDGVPADEIPGHVLDLADAVRTALNDQAAPTDHAVIAMQLLEAADADVSSNFIEQTGERKADVIAAAQVHATLAQVEQLRLGNLIALGSHRIRPNDLPEFRHLVSEPVGEFDVRPTAALREGLGL